MTTSIRLRRMTALNTILPRAAPTLADWLRTVAKIQTSNEEFYRLFRRALEDMAALRLPIEGTDHTVFLPGAELPWTGSATRSFRPIGFLRVLGLRLRRILRPPLCWT